MPRWLLTVAAPHDAEATRAELNAAGGELDDLEPIPFDDGTEVVFADGPADLPDRLRARDATQILKASPDSEQRPYPA